jgi:hypothetical protein
MSGYTQFQGEPVSMGAPYIFPGIESSSASPFLGASSSTKYPGAGLYTEERTNRNFGSDETEKSSTVRFDWAHARVAAC